MGFLDKVKGTAKQAMNPAGQAAERDKIMKVSKSGVQMNAMVDAMQELGTQLGGGYEIEFDLTVHLDRGEDYQGHVSQSLHDVTLSGAEQGTNILLNLDPADPQSVLVWGAAS